MDSSARNVASPSRVWPRLALVSLLVSGLGAIATCGPEANKTDNVPRGSNGGGGSDTSAARNGGAGGGAAAGSDGAGSAGQSGSGNGAAGNGSGNGNDAGTPPVMVGAVVPLPLSVTAQFPNQGWFGDPVLEKAFGEGSNVIRQVDATTGPCMSRQAPMRGKCLKITFTPPAAGAANPDGGAGWVGVFFLTTILKDHSDLVPPLKIGQPNWGDAGEAGVNIAPGATKISFNAAADVEGQSVSFKAGVDKDSFVVAEQAEVLGTAWKSYSLSLAGAMYGNNVIGGFAWVLTDTSKPATFYLDNIIWE